MSTSTRRDLRILSTITITAQRHVCAAVSPAWGSRPPRQMAAAVFTASTIVYWENGTLLAGRSIPPDPAPPRPSA